MTTIAGREAVTHELKTWPEYFAKILDGSKRFELRNSDRDFRVGDLLRLREWRLTDNEYTGREITVRVTYLTTDTNWMNGYSVAMSIEPVADKPTPAEPHADAGKMVAVGEGREYDEIGVPIGLREMTISQEAADQLDRIMREPSSLKIVPQRIEVVGEGRELQCVVCSASLMPPNDPPHCEDCAVTDEIRCQWEDVIRREHPTTAETERLQTELTALREQLAAAERERDAAIAGLTALSRYVAVETTDDDGAPLVGLAYEGSIMGPCYNPKYEPYELLEKIEEWLRERTIVALAAASAKGGA